MDVSFQEGSLLQSQGRNGTERHRNKCSQPVAPVEGISARLEDGPRGQGLLSWVAEPWLAPGGPRLCPTLFAAVERGAR